MRALAQRAVLASQRWPPPLGLCAAVLAPAAARRGRRCGGLVGVAAVDAAHHNPDSAAAGTVITEESITSITNNYVKHLVRLREKARYRHQKGKLLLVGSTIVRELAECGAQLRVAALLLQPGAPSPLPPSLQPERVVRISEAVALKISGLETISPGDVIVELNVAGQGLLKVAELRALFGLPAAATEDGPRAEEPATVAQGQQRAGGEQGGELAAERPRRLRRLLALEAVQDPGNLGTLLRCAMAFGWDGVVLLPGCCDPFNEKALRASRGAALRLPLAECSWGELEALSDDGGLLLLAAEPQEAEAQAGEERRRRGGQGDRQLEQAVCLVLGSEGQGLSQTALRVCRPVAIPMVGQMESLNVGIAGGILMFMLSEGLPPLLKQFEGLLGGDSTSGALK